MENKQTILPHSDKGFVHGVQRYLLIDEILKSSDWIDLCGKLKKINLEKFEKLLYEEFKMYNYIIKIEQLLCEFLYYLSKNELIVDISKIKNTVIERTARNRYSKDKKIASQVIDDEINGNFERLLNPHILKYVAGLGLGDLVSILRDQTKDFSKKDELLECLTEFNEKRKLIIHNVLSSRESVSEIIEDGIKVGDNVISIFNKLIDEYDVFIFKGGSKVLK